MTNCPKLPLNHNIVLSNDNVASHILLTPSGGRSLRRGTPATISTTLKHVTQHQAQSLVLRVTRQHLLLQWRLPNNGIPRLDHVIVTKGCIVNYQPSLSVASITQSISLFINCRPRPHLGAIGGECNPLSSPASTCHCLVLCLADAHFTSLAGFWALSATTGDQQPIVAPTPRPNHLGIHDQCLAHGRHVFRFPGRLVTLFCTAASVYCTILLQPGHQLTRGRHSWPAAPVSFCWSNVYCVPLPRTFSLQCDSLRICLVDHLAPIIHLKSPERLSDRYRFLRSRVGTTLTSDSSHCTCVAFTCISCQCHEMTCSYMQCAVLAEPTGQWLAGDM